MSLTLHQGSSFEDDPRFSRQRTWCGCLEILCTTYHYDRERSIFVTIGTEQEMIARGLCAPGWFPQGRKRVARFHHTDGSFICLDRLKGGRYRFRDENMPEDRLTIYEKAFEAGRASRPHLRLVWSAPVLGK